jgi:hypothetical protein
MVKRVEVDVPTKLVKRPRINFSSFRKQADKQTLKVDKPAVDRMIRRGLGQAHSISKKEDSSPLSTKVSLDPVQPFNSFSRACGGNCSSRGLTSRPAGMIRFRRVESSSDRADEQENAQKVLQKQRGQEGAPAQAEVEVASKILSDVLDRSAASSHPCLCTICFVSSKDFVNAEDRIAQLAT